MGDTQRVIPNAEQQPTMTVEEAAKALGIGRSAAYAATQRGEIPSIRIGRRVVVPTAAIRRLLLLDDRPVAITNVIDTRGLDVDEVARRASGS